jgi:hypothetical protein
MRSYMRVYVCVSCISREALILGRVDSALQVSAMMAGSRTWPDVTSTLSGWCVMEGMDDRDSFSNSTLVRIPRWEAWTILISGIDPFLSTALSTSRLLSRQLLIGSASSGWGRASPTWVIHGCWIDWSEVVYDGLSN